MKKPKKEKQQLVIGGGRINPCKAFPQGAVQFELQRGLRHVIVTVGGMPAQIQDAMVSAIQLGAELHRQSRPQPKRRSKR